MLIILEGCDGSGKTTIAEHISKLTGGKIVHCTSKTPNTVEYFKSILEESKNSVVIADRFCYGQFIYQDEEDRWMTKDELYGLELDMLFNYDVRLFRVTAGYHTLMTRLNGRGESHFPDEKNVVGGLTVDSVQRKYDKLFANTILPITTIDTTGGELAWVISK